MSQKKNDLKKNIQSCFYCGKDLNNIKDKIIHRINKKKGIARNNIVVLCPICKHKFSLEKFKIFLINIPKSILNKYFSNKDNYYKKVILKSLQYQRDNYGKE